MHLQSRVTPCNGPRDDDIMANSQSRRVEQQETQETNDDDDDDEDDDEDEGDCLSKHNAGKRGCWRDEERKLSRQSVSSNRAFIYTTTYKTMQH